MQRRIFLQAIPLLSSGMATATATEKPKVELYAGPWLEPSFDFIKDPDDFAAGDVWVNIDKMTIDLKTPATMSALYSYLKEEWKTYSKECSEQDLIFFQFPLEAITREMFYVQADWTFSQNTFNNVRNCGFEMETDPSHIYPGIIILGRTRASTTLKLNGAPFHKKGPVNQVVKIPKIYIDSDYTIYGHNDIRNLRTNCGVQRLEPMCYRVPIFER